MSSLLLLGSTGSIGTQALDVVRQGPAHLPVAGLSARSSWRLLLEQAREFNVPLLALTDAGAAEEARAVLPAGVTLFSGPEANLELIAGAEFDTAVHGIVGCAGLEPSVAVLQRGCTLALANKESLVAAGEHLMALSAEHGAEIIPVDSEHCAVAQCMRGEDVSRVRRVILTASGGPFRDSSMEEMANATPAQALKHPNWDMGPRITIGSATLMNKAMEIVELHHLLGLERERIQVVIHPQSIVHSMVEFVDGAVMAQMGPPDMRGPIHYAVHYPERAPAPLRGFDVDLFSRLEFLEPDRKRFPALDLGFECVEEGGDAGCVLNAADEIAVQGFLEERIALPDICAVNRAVFERRPGWSSSISSLLRADQHARELAEQVLGQVAEVSRSGGAAGGSCA